MIGPHKWKDAQHIVLGCPHAVYKNFSTPEQCIDWIFKNASPEAPRLPITADPESIRRWEYTRPIDTNNLNSSYVYIPEHTRRRGGGLTYIISNDEFMLRSRQEHTPGH